MLVWTLLTWYEIRALVCPYACHIPSMIETRCSQDQKSDAVRVVVNNSSASRVEMSPKEEGGAKSAKP
jgi:hypothetical protein